MSASVLSDATRQRALSVAGEIGRAIRTAREKRGESQQRAADAIGAWQTTISRLGAGSDENVKLGTVVRLLERYGLALVVIDQRRPIAEQLDPDRVRYAEEKKRSEQRHAAGRALTLASAMVDYADRRHRGGQ